MSGTLLANFATWTKKRSRTFADGRGTFADVRGRARTCEDVRGRSRSTSRTFADVRGNVQKSMNAIAFSKLANLVISQRNPPTTATKS